MFFNRGGSLFDMPLTSQRQSKLSMLPLLSYVGQQLLYDVLFDHKLLVLAISALLYQNWFNSRYLQENIMSELDPFVQSYQTELDAKLATHLEDFTLQIKVVFDEADAALVGLGRRLNPEYPWIPRATERDSQLARVRSALLPFKSTAGEGKWQRTVYRINPGDIGPVPEELIPGETYALKGFATEERICCSPLYMADFEADSPGQLVFREGDEYRMDVFDGQTFRYDGHFVGGCSDCGDHTSFDSFTLLRPDGSEALDRDYIPRSFAASRGMVTVVAGPASLEAAA